MQVLGEERLGAHYCNFFSEPFIGSSRTGFSVSVRVMKPSKSTRSKKQLSTPLYEWKDAPIGRTIIYPPASRRAFGKTPFDKEMSIIGISAHPSGHDSFAYFKHPGTIILIITTCDRVCVSKHFTISLNIMFRKHVTNTIVFYFI